MIGAAIDFETVIEIIDNGIKPLYLNKLQEIILKETWQGKTYTEIARAYNYESEYIKSAGCELWKLISQSFKQPVNKSNFVAFIRRIVIASSQSIDNDKSYNSREKTLTKIVNKNNWTTAPDISHLLDNDDDIQPLVELSKDHRCRCILISGMIGSGKTTLATKFAYKQQKQFDYVVWLSVQNTPPVETLLKISLQVFDSSLISSFINESVSFEALLVELLSYLRNYRCLLILDGLQEVLECTDSATYYRQDYEQYGQFIRSIITTNNKTLLVITSRINLKPLNYYGQDRVRFLTLGEFNKTNVDNLFPYNFNHNNLQLKWSDICQYYLYNPQLLKIVASNLEKLPEIITEESMRNIVSLEEIDNLLNFELSYLSRLEKEIIHWLAIDSMTNTYETLMVKIEQPLSKIINLLEALNHLTQRSLVQKCDRTYVLAPLIKDHIQRKLIRLSLQH
ncbi:MAG: NB-ARC domain-containing protein [Xenococcaceae cyanobacterium MO_207.B15]|nr:NB-ARC domain-containing protein [Xenococcaceae cyanobacterium MO_207.B15]